MARKNRKREDAQAAQPEFQNNPFASMDKLIPKEILKEEKPEKKPVPAKKETEKKRLSSEDQSLLEAFGGEMELKSSPARSYRPAGPRVTLQLQRKGKGGKTVTRVTGLEQLDMLGQMELARDIARALGTNSRFDEGVLELQGDQRDRGAKWFEKHGYSPRIA